MSGLPQRKPGSRARSARALLYRRFRDHQRKIAANSGGMLTSYPTGRTEISYGSAPFGEHALSAFISSIRHQHFVDRLNDYTSA